MLENSDTREDTLDEGSPPRFVIMREGLAPKRRNLDGVLGLAGALTGSVRTVVEEAYVAVAKRISLRTEQLEDSLAARRNTHRARTRRSGPTPDGHGLRQARPLAKPNSSP